MFDLSYLALIVVTLIIGLAASANVRGKLKKYSRVESVSRVTGAQMAQMMLSAHGISGVAIKQGHADQNHFDPRSNSITLEPSVYHGTSVTAVATACHEVGHACQFAQGYAPMKIRGAIVPAVNLASNAWMFLLILGIVLNLFQLALIAVVLYAIVVVFQLVTLPVEFDASNRARAYIARCGAPAAEQEGASKVLTACALTYVAAALTSILQLLWALGVARRD